MELLKCPLCGDEVTSKQKLVTHTKLFHENEHKLVLKWMKCVICHQGFAEKGGLIKHFALNHLKSVEWNPKTAKVYKKLAQSLKTQECKKPTFECKKCDYRSARNKKILKYHMISVHGRKKFENEFTNKVNSSQNQGKSFKNQETAELPKGIYNRLPLIMSYLLDIDIAL